MATKTKTKTPVAKQFIVTTEASETMIVTAKDKKEAEQTGSVLFLQHGHYSNENPPVIENVKPLESSDSDEDE